MIGEWPNKKNIESLNLTQKVNIFRLWRGKSFYRLSTKLKQKYNVYHVNNLKSTLQFTLK